MASSDARPIAKKNAAFRVTLPIFDADGDLVTGAADLDSEVSKDGGTFADCTNEATEIATDSGIYYLDLTDSEMNADTVAIIVKTSTSGAKTTPLVVYPVTGGIKELYSDTTIIYSDTTLIHSETTIIASDVIVIDAALTNVHSETTIIQSDTTAIESELILVHSETTIIASDVIVLDAAVSDVESSLVIIKSDLVLATSDTTAIESELILVHSETTIIASDVATIGGAGAVTFTYTLTSSVDSAPVPNADVWVTSDEAGSYVLASGTTDANGEVVFYLDTGTVYVWRAKTGWDFTNPDTETVS